MATSSHVPALPQHFFSDFWQILIDIAKSIDRDNIREKISGSYIYLLDFLTQQFLHQRHPAAPNVLPFNSKLNHKIMQFAEKYHWDLKDENRTVPSAQKIMTPFVLDRLLQEYINFTQGDLPNNLDLIRALPEMGGVHKPRGKKFAGSFFTPPLLARVLVQKVITNFLATGSGYLVSDISVLDPSLGSGIFLVESARILLQQFTRAFPGKTKRDLILELVNNHLFGMDILPEAIQTTKCRLILWAAAQDNSTDTSTLIPKIDFKQHLYCVDTLTISSDTFFQAFGCKNFLIIIGNPPFLHTRTGLIESSIKKQLKSGFSEVIKGQWDLCTPFIRRIRDFLAPKGHWGFVLPTRFLSNEHYAPIRRWVIDNFHIQSLVDAGIAFPGAGVEVFLLIAGPHGRENESFFFEQFDGSTVKHIGEMPIAELTQFPFNAIPWLPEKNVRNLVLRIGDQPLRLGELLTITRGFECGFNDNSIGTKDQLVQRGHSQANLQPIIKGSNIHRFSILPNTPPRFCVPDWGRPSKFKTSELFANGPKIVIRFVANEIIAAMDEIGYLNTNGVYNLHAHPPFQPKDMWWLLAILNSTVISFWFKRVFSNRDKLFPHIQKNQLEAIPIPELSNQEQKALAQISNALQTNIQNKTSKPNWELLCNALCTAIYFKDPNREALLMTFESNATQTSGILINKIQEHYAPLFNKIDEKV